MPIVRKLVGPMRAAGAGEERLRSIEAWPWPLRPAPAGDVTWTAKNCYRRTCRRFHLISSHRSKIQATTAFPNSPCGLALGLRCRLRDISAVTVQRHTGGSRHVWTRMRRKMRWASRHGRARGGPVSKLLAKRSPWRTDFIGPPGDRLANISSLHVSSPSM